MKKTFKFFAAALAIVAAASCAKEISNDNIQNETPAEETVHMTFSASFDSEGETKTVLAENNFVHWTDEDAISLFYTDGEWWYLNDGVFSIDPSSNDVNPTFAVFSGDTKPSKKYYAVSPASGWSVSSSTNFQYSGLSTQNAVKDSFDPSKHLAMSVSTSGDVFKFQNACALLKVRIVGEGVYSIKVEGEVGEATIGEPVKFRPGSLDVNQVVDMYNSNPSITLTTANSTPLENGATYYIVVPHVTVKNFKVSICDVRGDVLVTKSKTTDFVIERNKIYDLGTFERPKYMVGDYYYADGTNGREYKSNVVGVIFYVGDPTEDDATLKRDYPSCTNGLVVGLSEKKGQLCSSSVQWNVQDGYMNVIGVDASGRTRIEPQASLMTGYNNTEVMRINAPDSPSLDYCESFTRSANGSVWYIPTIAEFDEMYKNLSVLNAALSEIEADKLIPADRAPYWTTSEEYKYGGYVARYNLENGTLTDVQKHYSTNYIRPIFAF